MLRNGTLSRRTALKGMGTAMALPFLEAMLPEAAAAGAAKPPLRMAFCFVPNGVNYGQWKLKDGEGSLKSLSYTLSPLKNVKDDVIIFNRLTHDKARANGDGAGDHARSNAAFLTAMQPRKHKSDIKVGISVDQVAARKIGDQTRFPSLELGIERGRQSGSCDSGYSCAYSSNISWRGPTTPNPKEVDPAALFQRLFGDPKALAKDRDRAKQVAYDKSVLDLVLEDAKRLQKDLGGSDRRKVDEYLDSVRAVEKQIQNAGSGKNRPKPPKSFKVPTGIPKENKEHLHVMADLMVLAFQADITRIATFSFANDGSNRTFPWIGVREGHHSLSHHKRNKEKLEKIKKIDRYYVEQFAALLEKMKSVKEGDGTLLDNSMVLYGCSISDGNRHNHEDLPIIYAGKAGGTIKTGRHLVYKRNTPLANLFLCMLDRMGVKEARFGDSTGRLNKLS